MFHTFVLQDVKLINNNLIDKQTTKKSIKTSISRLLLVLPLVNKQAILFYSDGIFQHIQLPSSKILYQSKLQGKPFDGAAINRHKVVIILDQKRKVVQIDLKNHIVKQIYSLTNESLYHSKKQVGQFYLSRLHVFRESQSFYIQQDLPEDRIVRTIFFYSDKQKERLNKLEIQGQANLVIKQQHPARQLLFQKLDQKSHLVKFKQNPQQNGIFTFQQIDMLTDNVKKISFAYGSFVLLSSVAVIKKISEEKYIICFNGKNGQHQIILLNTSISAHSLWTIQSIIKQCLSLDLKANIGIFSFFFGKTLSSQPIKAINLQNGAIIAQIQIQVDKSCTSLDNQFIVQYNRQRRYKQQTNFKAIHLVGKQTHYFKILENLGVDSMFGSELCETILGMLNQKPKVQNIVQAVQQESSIFQ